MQYSDDLRQKLVAAWQAGYGTQAELSEWFGVSLSWVEKVLRRWRTTGQTAARPHRHGPLPVLDLRQKSRLCSEVVVVKTSEQMDTQAKTFASVAVSFLEHSKNF